MAKRRLFCVSLLIFAVLSIVGVLSARSDRVQAEPAGGEEVDALMVSGQMGGQLEISLPASSGADCYRAAVAYNWRHREYLVAWHNVWPNGHRDIYAQRVSETGELLTWFSISAGPNDRVQPALAYNATNDEYLAVWMYNANGDGMTYEIWGRTIAWNGGYQNPPFKIVSWPNRTFWTPRVAWNSFRNEYMVVWAAVDTATGLPTDVAHALLTADGTQLFATIISSNKEPHQADIAYNLAKDEFLVVWRQMWAPANGDILAARVSGNTAVVVDPPGILTVSAPGEDQLYPSVATNEQDRYLVAWQHAYPGPCCDWDIRARELNADGGLVGTELTLAGTTDDETAPQAAARGGFGRQYLVAWQRTMASGEAVEGKWWDEMDARWLNIANYVFWDAEAPAVAAGKTSFLAVYEGDAQGDPTVLRQIYGRRWVPHTTFLPLTRRK